MKNLKDMKEVKMIELESVGCVIDPETGIVYPLFENGAIDLGNGVEFECLDQDWLDQLSGDDVDTLRNNEFVIW
jgi:hypothetical protein